VLIGIPADSVAKEWATIRQAYKNKGPQGYREALLALARKVAEKDPDTAPPMFAIGVLYAQAGDKDRAFEYFERSLEQREPDILRLQDPILGSIRSDPRFRDIVRRVGLPQ